MICQIFVLIFAKILGCSLDKFCKRKGGFFVNFVRERIRVWRQHCQKRVQKLGETLPPPKGGGDQSVSFGGCHAALGL